MTTTNKGIQKLIDKYEGIYEINNKVYKELLERPKLNQKLLAVLYQTNICVTSIIKDLKLIIKQDD